MKENNQALIDDDLDEGGNEPELIANHPLTDILDKQYSEIENLKIEVEGNQEVLVNCVMNHGHILDPKFTYIACNCPQCPELGDNICYDCIKSCHSEHITDNRNIIQNSVNITQVYCSCANCGHKKKELIKKEVEKEVRINCQMIKLLGKESFVTFYVDRSRNKFYCPFCRKNCMSEINAKATPVAVSRLRKEEFQCSCREPKYHSKKIDDCLKLSKLFLDKKIDNDLYVTKVPGNIIKSNGFDKIFISDIKEVYNDLKNSLLLEKRVKQNMTKTRYLSEKYLNVVKLLRIFNQNLVVENAFEINDGDTHFSELFNFDFINSLFDLFSAYRKEMSQSEITHSNDTFIIQLKTDALFFYRNFVILPKTKPFKVYGLISSTENSTPVMRLITKKHFDEFLNDLNVPKEEFYKFIKNIQKTIERYDDHLVEYNVTEKLNSELISEYLDILIILASLRYTKNEDIKEFYLNILIEGFNSVVKVVKKYKIDPKIIKSKIELFIRYTFLNFNDEIFYREVFNPSKKMTHQSTIGIFSQKKEGSLKRRNSIMNNIIDEEHEDEQPNEPSEFDNTNFIFESNPLASGLLNSLFAFKKSTNDYNVEFKKWEIYDWLGSENDFYIEPLKSLYESYSEKPETKLKLAQLKIFTKPSSEIRYNSIEQKQNVFKKIVDTFDEIKNIFNNYFLSNEKPDDFCKNVITKLQTVNKLYQDNFPKVENKVQTVERKLFQMHLFKFEIINELFLIYKKFQFNNSLTKFVNPKLYEELISLIFELLSLFSHDNPFIASILFTNESLGLFLAINKKFSQLNLRVKFIEIKHYLIWLKDFKEYNNKLNLIGFCKSLKNMYLYLEDLLSKNIADKGFKITAEQEKLGINIVKGTFSKLLGKVKDAIESDKKTKLESKIEIGSKGKSDIMKIKEESMKQKKIEIFNKKVLEKLKSEGECYYNLDINFTSDDLLDKIIYIVNCLIKCCKLSTEKSVLILNNIILDIIYKLYKSKFYYQIWEKYKRSLNESLIEEEGSKFGIPTKDIIKEKLNDYNQASLIDTNQKITEKEHGLVMIIYKLLYKIDDYSFYLITDEIPKFEIKIILQDKIDSLQFMDRKILSAVYMRYYFISPFNILSNLNKLNMDSITKLPDCNINGAIISTSKEELKSVVRKKTREIKMGLFDATGSQEVVKEERNVGQDRAFKFLRRYRIVEQSLGLEPLISNLEKYQKMMQIYLKKDIISEPHLFLEYFKNVVLLPIAFSLYKLLYFTNVMTLHYKYLIYKIIFLFFECLKYFLETLMENNEKFLENEKYKKLFKKLFFLNEEKENESIKDLENIIKDILPKLSELIDKMKNDQKFEPLKTLQLLEHICEYFKYFKCLEFLNLELDGKNYRKKEGEDSKKEIANISVSLMQRKVGYFIESYEKTKKEGIEGENKSNILINLFSETTGEDEPEAQQLKVNIILDLMLRLNFKQNKKVSIYPRGKEESLILVSIINKIYKADPDLWHNCLVDIATVTKQVLRDIIYSQLTFLIQYIYIDYHKLKDIENNREGLTSELSAMNKFLIIIEFLRLFCENHHKIYQTILMGFNINKFYLKNVEESLDLLNFVLKIPTMIKNSIEYCNSKTQFLTIFKKDNNWEYFSDLNTAITDFLIEVIQGCFESNMKYFALPSSSLKNDENEGKEKKDGEERKMSIFFGSMNSKTGKKLDDKAKEKGNKDFEKYIETGYSCLDNLNKSSDKLCLAQFLRFIICFFEETSNPTENKEEIIKMLNPKKLLVGLTECTINLYKKYNKDSGDDDDNSEDDDSENKNIEIPDKFNDQLINFYLKKKNINENIDFIISSNIFKYFSLASQYKKAEKVRQCLRELKTECEDDSPIMSDKNRLSIVGRREAYRFFSKIVNNVEIFYKPKDTMTEQERKKFREFFTLEEYKQTEESFQKLFELKGDVQKVVFFVDPASLFAKPQDKDDFLVNAPSDKNEKLTYLLDYMSVFKSGMSIRKKIWKKKNKLLNILYNINYRKCIIASTLLSIIINIIVLESLFYIKEKDTNVNTATRNLMEENYDDDKYYNNYLDYYQNKTTIISNMNNFLLEKSDDKWQDEIDNTTDIKDTKELKDNESGTITEAESEPTKENEEDAPVWKRKELFTPLITFLTVFNFIFIFFIMANWIFFEHLKYEKEEEEENEDKEGKEQDDQQNESINVNEKKGDEEAPSIITTIKKLFSTEISALSWNLFLSIFSIISINFHFLYSIQLFTMFFLVDAMFTVIYSVQMRYDQFLATGFIILIISLFFGMIKYKWFTAPDECFTYSECFFDMLNSGIRGGSGMGFGIKNLDQKGYLIEFILEWIIFLVVMLVLLNIINGVIVDTFLELREKSIVENETKLKKCFICSLHRNAFEKRGIDFEYHKEHEHNIMNYFNYIFKIDNTDESDLNSLDYQVLQSIKNKRTDFFPVNTCISFSSS